MAKTTVYGHLTITYMGLPHIIATALDAHDNTIIMYVVALKISLHKN